MKLYLNDTSPFARLVLICISEYNLPAPELVWVNPWSFSDDLLPLNPFSMVPTLELDDGEALYESGIIVNYLTQNQHIPQSLLDFQTLALGKTLLDTAFRHVSLSRYAPDGATPHPFIARTEHMIIHALESLPSHLNTENPSLATLQLFCALDYVNFRLPLLAQKHFSEYIKAQLAIFKRRTSFVGTTPEALKNLQSNPII